MEGKLLVENKLIYKFIFFTLKHLQFIKNEIMGLL